MTLDTATLPHWQNNYYIKYSATWLLAMTSLATPDNVIPGRGWRPSSLAGCPPRGRSAQPPSCADWFHHAVTVTSYVRLGSPSVGLALVARDLGRRRSADQSWRRANREGTESSQDPGPPGQWVTPNNGHAHQPSCYITLCNVSAPLQWWSRWLQE